MIIRGMTFEFEYNGEFEFIFENVLSMDQEGACDKKTEVKNLVQEYL
jgi:hypothetical protein